MSDKASDILYGLIEAVKHQEAELGLCEALQQAAEAAEAYLHGVDESGRERVRLGDRVLIRDASGLLYDPQDPEAGPLWLGRAGLLTPLAEMTNEHLDNSWTWCIRKRNEIRNDAFLRRKLLGNPDWQEDRLVDYLAAWVKVFEHEARARGLTPTVVPTAA